MVTHKNEKSVKNRQKNQWVKFLNLSFNGMVNFLKHKAKNMQWAFQWTSRTLPQVVRYMFAELLGRNTRLEGISPHREAYFVKAVHGKAKGRQGNWAHRFGEDAWFICSTEKAEVLGVADGVGSWRSMGIDPGKFSNELMYWCYNYAERASFEAKKIKNLLISSYVEMMEQKYRIYGSSTACLVALDRSQSRLYTANLGDSGFMVIRSGRLVHKSEEQCHGFNTPFQLTAPPEHKRYMVHCDRPEDAQTTSFALHTGDVVLVATDGLFDNVSETVIIQMLKKIQGVTDPDKLQGAAHKLVTLAYNLSQNPNYESPFSLKARQHNIDYDDGGKPDDITVMLATVAMR